MTKGPAIGIDFGTTYSCVGIWQNDHVEIIPNDLGKRKTPSWVSFTDSKRLIGDRAVNQAGRNYRNTIYDIKRLIGCDFKDNKICMNKKYWPFKVIKKHGKANVKVKYKNEVKDFTPEEISSMILLSMKETAEKYIGYPVTDAVISVPSSFNDTQRRAIMDAGAIAGLNVLNIINETSATAISYSYNKENKCEENVLIVDIGGGTFDVSIISINNGALTVKAAAGDSHLGGEDFDNRLVDYFVEEFKKKHKKDLLSKPKSLRRLKIACEKVKQNLSLSSFTEASIDLDYLFDDIDFTSSITRSCFEELCSDLFEKIINTIEGVIQDSKLNKSDVNEIILVGGSTRIPKIQDMISSYFDGKPINKTVNVNEAVTCGAAIQASILSGQISEQTKAITLSDVITHSIGIGIDGHDDVMEVVIERNSPIPHTKTINYELPCNQESYLFKICEGENQLLKDNYLLDEYTVNQIVFNSSNIRKKFTKIISKITSKFYEPHDIIVNFSFNIDINGIVNVFVETNEINYYKKKIHC